MGEKSNGESCAIAGQCPSHSHTLERLATVEKGMASIEVSMNEVVNRLTTVRDQTMTEFKLIREDITRGILRRYPAEVVIVISILTGLCGWLASALFDRIK